MMFSCEKPKTQRAPDEPELRCSFCNKGQNDVRKLIAGPTVYICDECVQTCVEIIAQDREAKAGNSGQRSTDGQSTGEKQAQAQVCRLCGFPVLLEDALAIEERGFLCLGCVGAVDTAIAERWH